MPDPTPCDNRACVNPDHLFAGTIAENQADMAAKGRAASRLTQADVEAARSEYASGGVTQRDLADLYGVAPSTMHEALTGARWWR